MNFLAEFYTKGNFRTVTLCESAVIQCRLGQKEFN